MHFDSVYLIIGVWSKVRCLTLADAFACTWDMDLHLVCLFPTITVLSHWNIKKPSLEMIQEWDFNTNKRWSLMRRG